jgi:hypothetical protein
VEFLNFYVMAWAPLTVRGSRLWEQKQLLKELREFVKIPFLDRQPSAA